MKTRSGEYAPWLLGKTVDQFCDESILPVLAEIEDISLSALKDVLLSPTGIALEVLYLDRSEGSEVTMHRYDPVNPAGGITIGTVRLLYRPGHYDILYKAQDLPHHAVVPTFLQFGSQADQQICDLSGMQFLADIPGMSYANAHPAWSSGLSFGGTPDFLAAPAPIQQCAQPVAMPTPAPTTAPVVIAQQTVQPHQVYVPATPAHLITSPTEMPQELVIRPAPNATFVGSSYQTQLAGPFRPSMWQFEDGFGQTTAHFLQTPQFRKQADYSFMVCSTVADHCQLAL
jgi:ubiquitin thioesterase protein OTUB1